MVFNEESFCNVANNIITVGHDNIVAALSKASKAATLTQDHEDSSVASSSVNLETESSNVSSNISNSKAGIKPIKRIKKLAGKFISLVSFRHPASTKSENST